MRTNARFHNYFDSSAFGSRAAANKHRQCATDSPTQPFRPSSDPEMKMQSQSRNSHTKLAWLDALFAIGMALAAVVYGNSARIPPGGLDRFLQSRITVINALFAGIFMLAWSKGITGSHLYRSTE